MLNEESIVFLIGPLIGLSAKHKLNGCLEQFLYNSNVRLYMNKIVKQTEKSSNWTLFELIEFNPICQLILWERNVLNKSEYFDHSLAILSSVGDSQLKQSLRDAIFDVKEYKLAYDHQFKANELDETKNQLIRSSISFFNEIKKVYARFSSFEDKHWIFEPLIKLYKMQRIDLAQQPALTEDELANYLISCLNYLILIYNFKSNYLWSLIEPKILFVYLTSIFLFKNGLFLNEELLKILKYFLIDLTRNYKVNFDCFEEKIPMPFNSIGDHFNELCASFKTDSYGNHIFSNYLLCFLTQTSHKIFRKKLFDEHAECLNYFVLKEDQLLIESENLMQPIETDLMLIESFLRILMSKDILKQRNPLLFKFVCTHVSKSLFDEQFHENRLQNQEHATKLINCLKSSSNQELKEELNRQTL